MLRTVQPLPNILSKEEITLMIDCAGDLRSLIATAATAGLRAAELRWMQWENVDLEEGQIDIRAKGGWRPAPDLRPEQVRVKVGGREMELDLFEN